MAVDNIARGMAAAAMSGGGGGGSSGGVLVVGVDADGTHLDKTWQEIHDADYAVLIYDMIVGSWARTVVCHLSLTSVFGDEYDVSFFQQASPESPPQFETLLFRANSANGYPVIVGD